MTQRTCLSVLSAAPARPHIASFHIPTALLPFALQSSGSCRLASVPDGVHVPGGLPSQIYGFGLAELPFAPPSHRAGPPATATAGSFPPHFLLPRVGMYSWIGASQLPLLHPGHLASDFGGNPARLSFGSMQLSSGTAVVVFASQQWSRVLAATIDSPILST